tara:strand:+ start:624 stop:1817 length:1194 start_codon:yes stop_codon:yes gene_type:complete
MNGSIDNEWFNFINCKNLDNNIDRRELYNSINESDDDLDNDQNIKSNNQLNTNNKIDNIYGNNYNNTNIDIKNKKNKTCEIPKCSDIYISTKTKISFLNRYIDLNDLYWKINILEYFIPQEGILKKQMKFISFSKDELNQILDKVKDYYYYKSYIIQHIENSEGKIKYKDSRKISIGISKKDIINVRSKEKSAFYNCFVIVIRVLLNDEFKEIHIKLFNTGKLEIPGIKDDNSLYIILDKMISIINKLDGYSDLDYDKNKVETVLINSNFNCGYFINREKLFNILKNKYNINSCYDPCSYPGIQSHFYYNIKDTMGIQDGKQPLILKENYIKLSFMIFRTGSILMVGKGNEEILINIYNFLKNIFYEEYNEIYTVSDILINKPKERKIKKKYIMISQ